MQEKQLAILRLLCKATRPLTGSSLAKAVGTSSRTILNYIRDINSNYSVPVILSTGEGYRIDRERAAALLEKVNTIPEGYRERTFYLCKKLLIDSSGQVDVFDLCEELCISYSLLKNDISKFNQSIAYLNVRLVTEKNQLKIQGEEQNKRKLMNHMLQDQESCLLDIGTLKRYFPAEDVDVLIQVLETVHNRHNYFLTDFSRINLLLHLLTIISRIRRGNRISDTVPLPDIAESDDGRVAQEIVALVERHFAVRLSAEDTVQLLLLVKSNSAPNPESSMEVLSRYMGQPFLDTLAGVVSAAEKDFCLQLNSRDFFMRFALHIHSLLERCNAGAQITNPLKGTLRTTAPFLYDVAIYIVEHLRACGLLHAFLSEDEISFIVLHIGAEIERQNLSESRIHCILVAPDYLRVDQSLFRKLLNRYGDVIAVDNMVRISEIPAQFSADLVISAVDKLVPAACEWVQISPFMTPADYTAVDEALTRIQARKELEYLRKNFDFYFSEKNFLICTDPKTTRDDAIHGLCRLLVQNNAVGEEYEQNVFKRENSSPTAFYNFAIPHSVCMEANANTIGVMLAPEGIRWGEHTVQIVFMMAIAPDSLTAFQTLYGVLTRLLTDPEVRRALQKCRTFAHLKQCMLGAVPTHGSS